MWWVVAVVAAGMPLVPAAGAADDGLIPRRVLDPLDQCPCWTGRAESLLLWRDAPGSVGLFDAVNGGTNINAAGLASDMAAGPRLSLFRHTGDLGAVEFNWFEVGNFDAAQAAQSGPNDRYIFADGVLCCSPFGFFTDVQTSMASSFQSVEVNRRFPTDGRIQWLAGFRWVEWDESLALGGVTDFQDVFGVATTTRNDLYGFQVGLDSILWRTGGRFWVEGLGKAGIFYNDARQFTAFTSTVPDPASISGGTSVGRAAFVGELGVTGVWQATDWLAIRTGWAAFWLGGLALAPDQLGQQCLICEDKPVTQSTDTRGSVFVNGITIGLEARY